MTEEFDRQKQFNVMYREGNSPSHIRYIIGLTPEEYYRFELVFKQIHQIPIGLLKEIPPYATHRLTAAWNRIIYLIGEIQKEKVPEKLAVLEQELEDLSLAYAQAEIYPLPIKPKKY